MEAYHPAHPRPKHLSRLYADAKKSALSSLQVQTTSNAQFASLHRKYRIQKDRLITWGFEWSDGEKGPDGNIDESVAKAGLTETVDSVLRNIQEVTEEAERIKSATLPLTKDGESLPHKPAVFDEARYQDLLHDLTTSIDILYELSTSRRALARGEHPKFDTTPVQTPTFSKHYSVTSFRSSQSTLVNSTFSKPFLSPYAGLPSRIEASALRLPAEGPPPYEAVGVPSTTRMVALLLRELVSESVHNALASQSAEVPVLIEYANYDATYRDTGVPPPLQRLESLAAFFTPMRADSQTNLSLLGYFEDPDQPRIGLVYDLPYAIQNRLQASNTSELPSPLSLLKLVQKANKAQSSSTEVPSPALENRFRMALRLTEQLHSLHASQLTHGNINSSSVIFTTTANDAEVNRVDAMRQPLWASFDLFSKSNIEGVQRASDFNIYRHPLDEPGGTDREFTVDVKYDLYGLGLILLEIGLWTPIGDLYKQKYTLADFKLRVEKIWIPKLAAKCGSAYMRAVETCLHLSDDTDGSRLTVEGIYGVLLQFLKRCCLLDDIGSSTELIPASELMSEPSSPATYFRLSKRQARRFSEASPVAQTLASPIGPEGAPARFSHRASTEPQLLRQATRTSRLSVGQSKHQVTGRRSAKDTPSFRDFKRQVTLVQRQWRKCQELREERRKAREANADQEKSGAEKPGKSKREEFPDVKLPQDILDHWQSTMCVQIQNLVERALRGLPEASSIRLCPYGESRETARPTLIVGCTSTSKVKHALKRYLKYDTNVYDVRVKKESIRRCRRSRRERAASAVSETEIHRSMAASWRDPTVERAVNPDYQERPLCGASIGAFRYDEHLPPVSFGGVVLVDGKPYGMSVHHMLEPEDVSEDENLDEGDEGADDESETSSLGSSEGSEEDDQSTVRPPSAHSSDEDPAPLCDEFGDCPGVLPGDMEEIAITQPALDDAIDLDLHAEEDDGDDDDDDEAADSGIDEDHLLSYRLGQIHASSGLKRTAKSHEGGFKSISQSLPQEIDWALFELVPPRVHPFNVIKGGRRYCRTGTDPAGAAAADKAGNSYPTSVCASDDLACTRVHCLGRTSGLAAGVVSSTMELVKIRGRSTFSASWTVAGDFGVGGDSGAWVIRNQDGKVCGHVLASRAGRTYICPMDLLLLDIKATLGAVEVSLPRGADAGVPGRPGSKGEEARVAESLMYMRRLDTEGGGGGVALPASPVSTAASPRTVEPV